MALGGAMGYGDSTTLKNVKFGNKVVSVLSLIGAVALSLVSFAGPASASELPFTSNVSNGAPIGLIVHFKSGVDANGLFGSLTDQQVLSTRGIPLADQHALGQGWHVLNFKGAVSNSVGNLALSLFRAQSNVKYVELNTFISNRGNLPVKAATTPSQPSATFKAASAVQKVAATDAWATAAPAVAAVKVTWAAPKSLNGAKLTSFMLQASFDSGKSTQDVPITLSARTFSATINSGLTPGQNVMLRVAAVTTLKNVSKVGVWSAWVSAVPTALPVATTMNSGLVTSTSAVANWNLLSMSDSGGLPVSYTAVASASGHKDVTCTSSSDTCTFTGLDAGVSYSVKVKAVNAHGASDWAAGFAVADPMYNLEWQLNSKYGINVEGAWTHTHGASTVTVAVVDSGITPHPDLDGQEWRNLDGSVYGYDFVSLGEDPGDGDGWDNNPTDTSPANEWHGTHVSGLIAAANNNIGVVGVAPGIKLLEVRALGGNGGSPADLIAALNWAAGKTVPGVPNNIHPAQVVNLSLGNRAYASCDTATSDVLMSLHNANIMVITAAGNDNSQAFYSYPGNCYPTINVGATGYTGDRAYYSNYGQGVDISAPGGDDQTPGNSPAATGGQILSTLNDGVNALGKPIYGYAEGTSMAAPLVSGIAALMYSLKPTITPDQIWEALSKSVTPWPTGSFCATAIQTESCGAGIANADGAVQYLLANLMTK